MIILLSFCYYHSAIIILLGWLIANSDPLPASIVLLLLHELVLPNCRAATVCLWPYLIFMKVPKFFSDSV